MAQGIIISWSGVRTADAAKPIPSRATITVRQYMPRKDEHYIVDLLDYILKKKGSRQHTFTFLIGDPTPERKGKKLCVDVYYDELKLVIEYHEKQHTESIPFWNKLTPQGYTRDEQREIYDQRRREVLPQNNIRLIELDYTDFKEKNKKLVRDKEYDEKILRTKLIDFL